jgi:hypothetical protein
MRPATLKAASGRCAPSWDDMLQKLPKGMIGHGAADHLLGQLDLVGCEGIYAAR